MQNDCLPIFCCHECTGAEYVRYWSWHQLLLSVTDGLTVLLLEEFIVLILTGPLC